MTILSPKYNDHFLFGVWFGLGFFKGIRKRLSTCGSYIKKKKLNRKKRSEQEGDVTSLDTYRFPQSAWETGTNTSHSCSLETGFLH